MPNTIAETTNSGLISVGKKIRPKTILVVDDNFEVGDIIVITLRSLGHACVEVARGGKQALEMAVRLRPDLVILDINMPEMDGIETAENLNLLHPCPIIFSSGLSDSETMRRTLDIPCVSYLAKPFSPAQLREAVDCS